MSAIIFCGPSLSQEVMARYPQFTFLPPVRQGEFYAAALHRPAVLGIIDGYFDGVPAVWHKEILWALDAGIAVFGAASMGALRAAEMNSFGMSGIGQIYEAYRDGQLTADDEVALQHGPAETGYMQLSEPMVNIRATIAQAVSETILEETEAERMLEIAKGQFYQERTWKGVIAEARQHLPSASCEKFSAWLPGGKVDQKREDSMQLLEAVAVHLANGQEARRVSFAFQWTEAWDAAVWRSSVVKDAGTSIEDEAILNELRLTAQKFTKRREKALGRMLASEELVRCGVVAEHKQVRQSETAFRTPRGLFRQADLEKWAKKNHTTVERFNRLMSESTGVEILGRERIKELEGRILDQLRLDGSYRKLRKRALRKARMKECTAQQSAMDLPSSLLVSWYFATKLDTDVPSDLNAYIAGLGMDTLEQFYDLLAAEYALSHSTVKTGNTGNTGRTGKNKQKRIR